MSNKKRKHHLNEQDKELFRRTMQDVAPLTQDVIFPILPVNPTAQQQQHAQQKKHHAEQSNSQFYFSDHYQSLLVLSEPTRYVSHPDINHQFTALRRGHYLPELFLDLHGLTQRQAKQTIASFIVTCQQQHIQCGCIIHGHGKHILKQQTPLWLAQHPAILAFHQAPKIYGGAGALLVLFAISDDWANETINN